MVLSSHQMGSFLPLAVPLDDGNLGPIPASQVKDEKQLGEEVSKTTTNLSSSSSSSVSTHTRAIGIIHPPLEIRIVLDKTAEFVAKNGPGFEKRVVAENTGNQKFNFLISSSPFHAYYQHRLLEFCAQNQSSGQQEQEQEQPSLQQPAADPSAQFKPVLKVLETPEAEEYTVRLPQGITGEDLDIIMLTSQSVARNGRSFLTGLVNREINNPQFHFLMIPTHRMFTFFSSLVDAYSKVVMPPKGLTEKLKKSVADMETVLERCVHRLEWERSQEQAKQRAEDEIEQERIQMAMIDWYDFSVVETINFADDEDEDLPPPMALDEVIRRSKVTDMEEDIVQPGEQVEMEMDEEEMQLVEEGFMTEDPEPPLRIVNNWKRPEDRILDQRDPTKYVISPITGELIPINEMSEHMRISLIDPKYQEQKERMFAKLRETTLAHDDEISRNILGLARTRPDIFGTTEDEVSNAVKTEIERKKDEQPQQVIRDGHTGSTSRTENHVLNNDARNLPGPAAPPLSRPPVVQYQSVRPPPPGSWFTVMQVPRAYNPLAVPPPTIQMMPPPPLPQGMPPPPLPEEPAPKRQKLDDSTLIPEDQFLAQHSGPVHITVSVPNVGEGNLKGQLLEIMVQSLSENVGSLKEKISGEIQLPANKQKLSGKPGFLKENMSLAYYNVGAGETLTLSLRERGGRKR
ncbi:PREDICTED: probable splicing factor 3A subunit 1 [Prunus mume]|uniref:Probable splicing factor 3A subunit 1 n=1 Tax=Prunus mume TaxID=102107 RepID=A0ABM0NSN7_PRUMU|nr:PREDICTED: probable splicing factor 3A subunit 1 [Prunus mume]